MLQYAYVDTAMRTSNPMGLTPLHVAKDLEQVMALYRAGADLNAQDSWLRTPLHLAVIAGNLSVVKCLLALGADASLMDKGGWTIKARIIFKLRERWISYKVRTDYVQMLKLCEEVS